MKNIIPNEAYRNNIIYKTYLKTHRQIFKAGSNGIIIRAWIKTMREDCVKPFMKNNIAYVKIAGKTMILKSIIAECFIPGFRKGDRVICKDGNEFNCALDNLKVITKSEQGRNTGYLSRSIPVQITINGDVIEYRSISEAAKALYISDETLRQFLYGKINKSVLEGKGIRFKLICSN